jgi:hypothetical protein
VGWLSGMSDISCVNVDMPRLLGFLVDGGCCILSKFRIVQRDTVTFEKGLQSDQLAAKGALHALVEIHIHRSDAPTLGPDDYGASNGSDASSSTTSNKTSSTGAVVHSYMEVKLPEHDGPDLKKTLDEGEKIVDHDVPPVPIVIPEDVMAPVPTGAETIVVQADEVLTKRKSHIRLVRAHSAAEVASSMTAATAVTSSSSTSSTTPLPAHAVSARDGSSVLRLHVFTLHLQSSYSPALGLQAPPFVHTHAVRMRQLAQLRAFIQRCMSGDNYDGILCGDFNINARPFTYGSKAYERYDAGDAHVKIDNDGRFLVSDEYQQMMDALHSPEYRIIDTLAATAAANGHAMHPCTIGDVLLVDNNVRPSETLITDREDWNTRQW